MDGFRSHSATRASMGLNPMLAALSLVTAACESRYTGDSAVAFAAVTELWVAGGAEELGGLVLTEPYAGALGPGDLVGVVDRRGQKIVLLSSDGGAILTEIGAAGDGPGEFRTPVQMGFTNDSLLWVTDVRQNRFSWFGLDGQYLRSLTRNPASIGASAWTAVPSAILADGAILALVRGPGQDVGNDSLPVALWQPDGTLSVPRWIRLRAPLAKEIPRSASGMGPVVGPQLIEGRPLVGASPDGQWLFVVDRTPPQGERVFTIERFDPLGNQIDVLSIPFVPQPVDDEVMDWLKEWARAYEKVPGVRAEDALEAFWIPKVLPPVRQALADQSGFWVRREQTRPGLWQRYGVDGELLVQAILPPNVIGLAANDSLIVGWESDSLQTPIVRAFRVEVDSLAAGHTSAGAGQLVLEELGAWSLNQAADLVQAAVMSDSSIAVLTEDGRLQLLFRDGRQPAALTNDVGFAMLIPSVDSPPNDPIAVAAPSGEMYRLGADGHLTRVVGTCLALSGASVASATADTVLALRQNPKSGRSEAILVHHTDGECADPLTLSLPCDAVGASVTLNPYGTAAVSCRDGRLFRLVREGGRFLDMKELIDPQGRKPSQDDISLAVIPLDNGFLRTFADITSYSRRIEWISDQDGRSLTLHVNDALGFVSASPALHLLLAMRTSPAELVLYTWYWK